MGWSTKMVVGDREVWVIFSRSGAFRRHLDGGAEPFESLRVSGRHLRLVVQRHGREQLSEAQRANRLRERV
jgi:hypothetical protein